MTSPEPPRGWYRVQQRHPDPAHVAVFGRSYGTLGLFCSAGCLAEETAEWAATAQAGATSP